MEARERRELPSKRLFVTRVRGRFHLLESQIESRSKSVLDQPDPSPTLAQGLSQPIAVALGPRRTHARILGPSRPAARSKSQTMSRG